MTEPRPRTRRAKAPASKPAPKPAPAAPKSNPAPETQAAPKAKRPAKRGASPKPRRARAKTATPAPLPEPARAPGPRRIWISGATGFVGKAIVRLLRTRGDDVIAAVRDPRKAADLIDMGVTVVEDDLSDVAITTEQLRDVDAAI